jgi:hypothetical protein
MSAVYEQSGPNRRSLDVEVFVGWRSCVYVCVGGEGGGEGGQRTCSQVGACMENLKLGLTAAGLDGGHMPIWRVRVAHSGQLCD